MGTRDAAVGACPSLWAPARVAQPPSAALPSAVGLPPDYAGWHRPDDGLSAGLCVGGQGVQPHPTSTLFVEQPADDRSRYGVEVVFAKVGARHPAYLAVRAG